MIAGACLALAAPACRQQTTDPNPETGGADDHGAAAPAPDGAAGGMKAYVDPQTGKFVDQPPPGTPPLPGDVITPPATVQEKPAAGGGMQLHTAPSEKQSN